MLVVRSSREDAAAFFRPPLRGRDVGRALREASAERRAVVSLVFVAGRVERVANERADRPGERVAQRTMVSRGGVAERRREVHRRR